MPLSFRMATSQGKRAIAAAKGKGGGLMGMLESLDKTNNEARLG